MLASSMARARPKSVMVTRSTTFFEEYVGGFDVAVDESLGVCGGESGGGLHGDAEDFEECEWAALVDSLLEGCAADVGHDEER